MTVLPEEFIILCFIIPWTLAGFLDQPCAKRGDCITKNSQCKLLTSSCGICTCSPGYIKYLSDDSQSAECRRAVYLDDECSTDGSNACAGDNVECSADLKRCVCRHGHKRGLSGTDCIPMVMDKTAGELCYDPGQCYYTLDCINFSCGCGPGFKTQAFHCVLRQIGDSCESEEDCLELEHSRCLNGTCLCRPGFKAVDFSTGLEQSRTICLPVSKVLGAFRGEGESCSPKRDVYCQTPLVCNSCGTEPGRCVNLTRLAARNEAINGSPIFSHLLGLDVVVLTVFFLFL